MSDIHNSASAEKDAGTNESVHTRIIDAPRENVFSAWTTPELLAEWWGPKGFTNTFQEIDIRPGGHWKFMMHGPDGKNYPNECIFLEISSPERIILRHVAPRFQIIADFENLNGKTRITFNQRFETAEELNKLKHIVGQANEENLDRLAGVVKKTLTNKS
ncbi:SRPBCC family protein [Paenibacillus sepulcri]|uniref:SRPBCC family protein n=1 Tax=Paenibacillus sepulcri TaxID=359917 RepID=A0ABS7C3J4_9BACL|nr:SRPBCC family protein [Paenibacillus sepulcri]